MSEERTQDITTKYDTKPTLETILQRIEEFREDVAIRLDRIESVATTTRGEMLTLRADFMELRRALREYLPALK